MSNDRVMVCNFETAVQTDPTTCLLVVSRSVVAPSNKKGLAPEVITAFARSAGIQRASIHVCLLKAVRLNFIFRERLALLST